MFTVQAPPRRGEDPDAHAERFEFVRDGFRWLAFLFPPLWFLANRMWLVLAGYLALVIGLAVLTDVAGLEPLLLPLGFALNLLIGLEADALKRWSYERKGWRMAGIVAGRDLSEAEHTFFKGYAREPAAREILGPSAPLGGAGQRPPRPPLTREREMIGMFPEPER